VHPLNRQAIFDGATNCRFGGKRVLVSSPGLTETDAKEAFIEWTNLHPGTGVSMRLTQSVKGAPAAEFTASSA
jgi:hypothetical protein